MRMSEAFAQHWRDERLDEVLSAITLNPELRALVHAPLVRQAGTLLLEPLSLTTPEPECFPDVTGYEAFTNKIHVDNFIDERASPRQQVGELIRQGTRAALDPSRRLEAEGRFRVLLSLQLDMQAMTLRLFERRDAEPWGTDNPDDYEHEAVLMIDTDARP